MTPSTSVNAIAGTARATKEPTTTPDEAASRRVVRKTLEERIAEAQETLRLLEAEKRKRDAEAKAENEKAVRRLLAAEGLLGVDVAIWRNAIGAVSQALGR